MHLLIVRWVLIELKDKLNNTFSESSARIQEIETDGLFILPLWGKMRLKCFSAFASLAQTCNSRDDVTDWTSRAPRPALSQEKATLLDGHILQHWIPWEKPSYRTLNWVLLSEQGGLEINRWPPHLLFRDPIRLQAAFITLYCKQLSGHVCFQLILHHASSVPTYKFPCHLVCTEHMYIKWMSIVMK